VPRGSYMQSCRDIERRGDHLRARCESRDGRWEWTELDDVDRCHGDITNMDGRLVCTR
jgi:hypothetical protein